MGKRRTQPLRWTASTCVPTTSHPVRMVVTGGQLVAFKVAPSLLRALMANARQWWASQRGDRFDPHVGAPAHVFTLADADPHTPRDSALQVGSWLGARVYMQHSLTTLMRQLARRRHKNGGKQ